jgi:hypothetical protein
VLGFNAQPEVFRGNHQLQRTKHRRPKFLLSQGFGVWCSQYRATQKGRGWLVTVFHKLTALGLKTKGFREMNSVGQSGDRKSYRVILLLVVGLTAFSSAMKELNLLREFTRDTSNMVASLSKAVSSEAPEPPKVVIPAPVTVVEEVEVCDSSHRLPEIELVDHLQLGGDVARSEVKIKEVGKTSVAERSKRRDVPAVATFRGHRSADIELTELRKQIRREADLKVMIMADSDGEVEFAIPPAAFEFKVPKVKNNRRINTPDERELLKTLHRSLNLRAG